MQTYAEKFMVDYIAKFIRNNNISNEKFFNIGAGQSTSIEDQINNAGLKFLSDRLDVEDCNIKHLFVDKSYIASIEKADVIKSDSYILAFSNYVLEHVQDIESSAKEINRVLKKDGIFVATIPNPHALEFLISRITPLSFHRKVRGGTGWKTYYSYKNINNLIKIFEAAGFEKVDVKFFPAVFTYLYKIPVLKYLAKFYDNVIKFFHINCLMGNVCVIFKKIK